MATVNYGPLALQVGPNTPVVHAISGAVTAELTIDRTVTGGLNSLTSASQLEIEIDGSNDGGATWQLIVGSTFVGGTIVVKGVTRTQDVMFAGVADFPGTGTPDFSSVRLVATVVGPSPITVSGQITTT